MKNPTELKLKKMEEIIHECEILKETVELAKLLKEGLLKLEKVRYMEMPEKYLVNCCSKEALRRAINLFCEQSEESDVVVYYAGCGCCNKKVWEAAIIASSAKNVILLSRNTYAHYSYDAIRQAGISLTVISLKSLD